MVRSRGRGGIAVVAVLAFVYGVLTVLGGATGVVAGPATALGLVVSVTKLLLGALLLPTSVGLVWGRRWGQLLGIVAFFGIPAVQLLPVFLGVTYAVPVLGIALSTACGLYLSLASEEFRSEDAERPTPESDDEQEYTHTPWR